MRITKDMLDFLPGPGEGHVAVGRGAVTVGSGDDQEQVGVLQPVDGEGPVTRPM
jgi:hypothetical protein